MSVETNLREMERSREAYWLRYPTTSPMKLRWRAITVRHGFHVLPGESLVELGAGSGLWTEHLTAVLRGENSIMAAVFNEDLLLRARSKPLPNVTYRGVTDLTADLPANAFDYAVGTAILCHDQYPQTLRALWRALKPGGQLLFFEANYWNPQVFLKHALPPLGRWAGEARCQIGLRKYHLMQMTSHQGFTHVNVIPYDIVHPRTPRVLLPIVRTLGFVMEHAPLIRELCGTLYIWARKPGGQPRPFVNLAEHEALRGSVSVVAPCHNEEMNVEPLVDALVGMYGPYLHEIIIVNDNSTDRTAAVTRELAMREPRVKLVDRTPPNGVGRALRDGYAAATGRYILTTDSDFVQIVPEFRDLFDAVARGRAGAIGSRFSHESMLINYPFFKILCNRLFHLLVNLLLHGRVRDISNNLKLYRTDIIKNLDLEENHFAANVETGLKPLLAGHDIEEVPISWINRTIDMGRSSFRVLRVGPDYFFTLVRLVRGTWRARRAIPVPGIRPPPLLNWDASCPLCGGREVTLWHEQEKTSAPTAAFGPSRREVSPGRVLRCRGCTLGFRHPRPSARELLQLYRDLPADLYDAEGPGRARTATRHVAILERHARPGRLLDVGCASGAFLCAAADSGWRVVGIEPAAVLCRRAAAALGSRGEVFCGVLEDAPANLTGFDAITLWDVLEHVERPLEFLRACVERLKAGGHLLVNVPDLESLPARILGARWPLLLPEHLNYFSPGSLRRCAALVGLRWLAAGRRPAAFSVDYVLYRLAQHGIPFATMARRLARPLGMSRRLIVVPLGELYAVWRR